jgi:PAS domain S-box-containing protein
LEELVKRRTKEIETQKEEILSQSEQLAKTNRELEKLSIVARETDNAILIVDPNGSIEWINEGFTRLFGYTLDDLKKSGTDIFKLSEKSDITSKIEYCINNKESVIYETMNSTKDGRNIWTQTTLTPIIDKDGEIYKLIAIDCDITRLKDAEEEIKKQKKHIEEQNVELESHRHHLEKLVEERTEDLKEAKEKAEQSDRLKSAFLANMSHEIRTPMNAIIGFTNMLNDPDVDESVRKDLMNQITYSSYSLLNLIDNIIDLAKVDSNQIEISKKDIEVNEVMKAIYDSFYENIQSKNLEFSLNLQEDILTIKTDDYRLKQIITNLLENAIKFTDKGYIKLGYRLPEDSDVVVFYVKDSGIGIPKDKLESVFQRFTKVEDNHQRLYRGAGLGLSLSKILVEKLGGKIWADSKVHEGSDFYFTIPRK